MSGIDCFFTKSEVLLDIADICKGYVHKNTTYVDYSCGTNEFAKMLGCSFISYDLNPAPNAIVKDWFTVKSVPHDSFIGLNPPFGYKSKLAKRFIDHAATFAPKYIAGIIPTTEWTPGGYVLLRKVTLPLNAFYIPHTGKDFSYPTTFYLWRRLEKNEEISQLSSARLENDIRVPQGITVKCRVPCLDPKFKSALVLRRTGYYACRQAYCVRHGKETVFIHDHNDPVSADWESNNHSLLNAYYIIYFEEEKNLKCLISLAEHFRDTRENETSVQERLAEKLRPRSVRKLEVLKGLVSFF